MSFNESILDKKAKDLTPDEVEKLLEYTMSKNKKQTQSDYLLKYLNKILDLTKKKNIKKLTDFKDIPKEDICNKDAEQLVVDEEKSMFKAFTKKEVRRGAKTQIKDYQLSVIKFMCSTIGKYALISRKHEGKILYSIFASS